MNEGLSKLNISEKTGPSTDDDTSSKLLMINNTYIIIRSEVGCY